MSPISRAAAGTPGAGGCGLADIPSLFHPSGHALPVFDPLLKRFGAFWVDKQYVSTTRALERCTQTPAVPPSLCLLHQKGECRAEARCNQLHVAPAFIATVRAALLPLPSGNCCLAHGDIRSQRREFQALLARARLVITTDGAEERAIPADRVAITAFWELFLGQGPAACGPTLRFSAARICRLHQRDACKFGMDCNNIHVCREFWSSATSVCLAGTPAAPSIGSPSRILNQVSAQGQVDHCPQNPAARPLPPGMDAAHASALPHFHPVPCAPAVPQRAVPAPLSSLRPPPPPLPVPLLELASRRGILKADAANLPVSLDLPMAISQGLSPDEYRTLLAGILSDGLRLSSALEELLPTSLLRALHHPDPAAALRGPASYGVQAATAMRP